MIRLQLITNYSRDETHRLYEVVAESIEAGCKAIQFSWGNCTDLTLYSTAEKIRKLTADNDVSMIVNNRLDVALAIDADALHIGQRDVPFNIARKMLPRRVAIGLTLDRPDQYSSAVGEDIDYFGIGPIFKTVTKADADNLWGLDEIKRLRAMTDKPLVAIGGITTSNVSSVMDAGADGVAVIGDIYRSDNIARTISGLLCATK
ncbi:MAG: thiamine phosphate synthase [Piscirickettsiaceae bacterium]|nr:thiamine phosphate synthase [Piscirickettsiaceae bacterium]